MKRAKNPSKDRRRIEKPGGRVINPPYEPGIAVIGRVEFLHATSMNFAQNAINKMRSRRGLGPVASVHAALAEILGADAVTIDGERAFGIHATSVASADLLGRTLSAIAPHTNRSWIDCTNPDGTLWRDELTGTGLVARHGIPVTSEATPSPATLSPSLGADPSAAQSEGVADAAATLPEDLVDGWEMGRNATLDAVRTALIEAGLAAGLDPAAHDLDEVEDILDTARALANQRHPDPATAATASSRRASGDAAA